jgi:hypothetical protein
MAGRSLQELKRKVQFAQTKGDWMEIGLAAIDTVEALGAVEALSRARIDRLQRQVEVQANTILGLEDALKVSK